MTDLSNSSDGLCRWCCCTSTPCSNFSETTEYSAVPERAAYCLEGPDVYRRILGPTPDESILMGLQTVMDICGFGSSEKCKCKSSHDLQTSRGGDLNLCRSSQKERIKESTDNFRSARSVGVSKKIQEGTVLRDSWARRFAFSEGSGHPGGLERVENTQKSKELTRKASSDNLSVQKKLDDSMEQTIEITNYESNDKDEDSIGNIKKENEFNDVIGSKKSSKTVTLKLSPMVPNQNNTNKISKKANDSDSEFANFKADQIVRNVEIGSRVNSFMTPKNFNELPLQANVNDNIKNSNSTNPKNVRKSSIAKLIRSNSVNRINSNAKDSQNKSSFILQPEKKNVTMIASTKIPRQNHKSPLSKFSVPPPKETGTSVTEMQSFSKGVNTETKYIKSVGTDTFGPEIISTGTNTISPSTNTKGVNTDSADTVNSVAVSTSTHGELSDVLKDEYVISTFDYKDDRVISRPSDIQVKKEAPKQQSTSNVTDNKSKRSTKCGSICKRQPRSKSYVGYTEKTLPANLLCRNDDKMHVELKCKYSKSDESFHCYKDGRECGMVEVNYAITKITRFNEFTTYEVMKPTKNLPKFLPKETEGIFVLRNMYR